MKSSINPILKFFLDRDNHIKSRLKKIYESQILINPTLKDKIIKKKRIDDKAKKEKEKGPKLTP